MKQIKGTAPRDGTDEEPRARWLVELDERIRSTDAQKLLRKGLVIGEALVFAERLEAALSGDVEAMRDCGMMIRKAWGDQSRGRFLWASACREALAEMRGGDAIALANEGARLHQRLGAFPRGERLSDEFVATQLAHYAEHELTPEGLAAVLAVKCGAFDYKDQHTARCAFRAALSK